MGCTPFLPHHGPKNSLRFSAHFCGLEKIGANNAPKKLREAIFACPFFANKIISAALKLSAKKWSLPSHEPTCNLSANRADKKERAYNSLSQPFNKLDNRIHAFYSNFLLFAFKHQQAFTSIWSEEKEILEKQKKEILAQFDKTEDYTKAK